MNSLDVLFYIMFVGLLPISFFWLRRAYLIGIKKDYTFVALKRGVPPDNPKKYAKFSLAVNLIAGLVLVGLFIFSVIAGIIEYSANFASSELIGSKFLIVLQFITQRSWTPIAGSTIWIKFILDFAISRQAHLKTKK